MNTTITRQRREGTLASWERLGPHGAGMSRMVGVSGGLTLERAARLDPCLGRHTIACKSWPSDLVVFLFATDPLVSNWENTSLVEEMLSWPLPRKLLVR